MARDRGQLGPKLPGNGSVGGKLSSLLGHVQEERLESRGSCGQLRSCQGKVGRRKVSADFRAGRKFPHCL